MKTDLSYFRLKQLFNYFITQLKDIPCMNNLSEISGVYDSHVVSKSPINTYLFRADSHDNPQWVVRTNNESPFSSTHDMYKTMPSNS